VNSLSIGKRRQDDWTIQCDVNIERDAFSGTKSVPMIRPNRRRSFLEGRNEET
jgi:hypothetical protein